MEYTLDSTTNLAEEGENMGIQKEVEYTKRAYSLIDLGDLDFKSIDPDTRRGYAGMIAGARPALDWLLRDIIKAQLEKWTRATWEEKQYWFHNGGINMADLILESIENLTAEHKENTTPAPKVDPTEPPLSSGADLNVI